MLAGHGQRTAGRPVRAVPRGWNCVDTVAREWMASASELIAPPPAGRDCARGGRFWLVGDLPDEADAFHESAQIFGAAKLNWMTGWARGRVPATSSRPSPTQSPAPGPRVCMTAGCGGHRAHTGYMGRMIWTILGAILAIWVGFMAIGWIFSMLKTFFVIGLIAVVVFIIVSLVAKRPRRG